jgi:hypothetical protein
MESGLQQLARAVGGPAAPAPAQRDHPTRPVLGSAGWHPRAKLALARPLPAPPTRRLADGTVGWFIRLPRLDQCWQAAVATCLQVPLDDVPDARLDARQMEGESVERIDSSAKREFEAWLARRGLQMVEHRTPPWQHPRWIGIVPDVGHFNDHCMLMCGDRVLFDPCDLGYPFVKYTASDVDSGITFATSE